MNRNQLCSCGSGKRYKHCHGAAIGAPPVTTRVDHAPGAVRRSPLETLHLALLHQQEGRLASAEALYQQAVDALPGHFDAIHMLGVVKLQLGKLEEAARFLVAALQLAPKHAAADCKHNLALALLGLARQRNALEALTASLPALKPPAPFVPAHAVDQIDLPATEPTSIILTGASSVSRLQRSLDGIRVQNHQSIEILAPIAARTPDRAALQAALDHCGMPSRLIVTDDAETLAGQVNAAADIGTGAYLCFLRAGDHWTPRWLQRMIKALKTYGAQWGYGGLRMVTDEGTIVPFGSSPEVGALLHAQDALYVHRTASLGFPSFNPVAAGRNLIVRRDFWQQRQGLANGTADPFLEWAWRTARTDEPVYVDEPGYLIPSASARLHLHGAFARLIGPTTRERMDGPGADVANTNPYLRHGLSVFWASQWRQIRSLHASTMPREVLLGCAAMLGVAPVPPTTSSDSFRAT